MQQAGDQQEVRPEEVRQRLCALLAGDRKAAGWLYDTFAPGLARRLRQRYGYPGGPDPEDLLQDAFLFYFQRNAKVLADFVQKVPPEWQTAETLEQKLWDLACGVASNRRRSSRRATVVPLQPEHRNVRVSGGERESIDRDTLKRLLGCLRRQHPRAFVYFSLRYCDGFSPDEIARMTGWSKKATYKLKQKMSLAMHSCAERLGLPWA